MPLSESSSYQGQCSYQFTAQEDTDVAHRKTYLKIQPQGHRLPIWGRSSLSTPYLCGWYGPHASGSTGTRASAQHCSPFLDPAGGGGLGAPLMKPSPSPVGSSTFRSHVTWCSWYLCVQCQSSPASSEPNQHLTPGGFSPAGSH